MIPGEFILKEGYIDCNTDRTIAKVMVVNTGDRPIQVGSHYHFFEVNKQMEFDRSIAFGMRLNIAAGTAVRFEPGEEKEVGLVCFGGDRKLTGFNNLVNGDTAIETNKIAATEKAAVANFKNKSA